jgi:calcineurin-like phosphoesterase family protein
MMQILCLSDQIVSFVQSPIVLDKFGQVDLIASCGDLPAQYLEYVVSMLNKPLTYVPGNHDRDDLEVQGGIALDGQVERIAGLWMAGLGGSRRYKRVGRHQYTELEMGSRFIRWLPRMFIRRLVRGHGLDILQTHSPPRFIHDADDWAHRGFTVFRSLIQLVRPRLMLHGHAHIQRNLEITETDFHYCRIINVFPQRLVQLEIESESRPVGEVRNVA